MTMLLGTWVVLLATGAADPIVNAERAFADLDFQRAAELSVAELKKGQLSPEQVQRAWAVRAQALGALGFAEDARVAFERALSLQPSFEVAPDASPKLSVPFQKARARMEGRRLAAKSTAGATEVVIDVVDDLASLISRAELQTSSGIVPMARLSSQFAAALSCADPCAYWVVLRDDFGNRVLELGSAKAPLTATRITDAPIARPSLTPPPATPPSGLEEVPAGRPLYKHPLPWLIGAGAAAIAGTVFAVRMGNDAAQLRQFDAQRSDVTVAQLRATEGSVRVNQALTGGFFAAAIGLAGVGVFVW